MEALQEVLSAVKEQSAGQTLPMPSFESVRLGTGAPRDNRTLDDETLRKNLSYIRVHNRVTEFRPIFGNPLAVFVKRVLRKLMRFQVGPSTDAQNDINENMVGVILYLASKVDELTEKVETLEKASATPKNKEEGELRA